ncbi:2-carboxy-1,4-naphthoquinone phytyltransferase, chloroplastic-like isoform X1 [Triticum dicoccoides]|uniref:2-carboxy-1,4-naphthoquinone phytyltransferase, chloroplastic-like isoform X1 n=1 Tax=Triticum dicoccoides TaxID=85692 RepID=UPI000E78DC84|nr:2-carboxy-1,4-naphthoquinone phytyltransferase, chloroplastic-like isoform X1 [Triticum dicoccoides]
MPLAGIALAPLLVSPLAPPSPRGSVAAVSAEPARRRRALRRVRCSAAAASGGGGDAVELSRATLLWRAAKLPIYSVALVPLTVGTAAAYNHAGLFFARRYFGLLAAAVLVITWLNLSNDVYDSDTGADKNKKESVVNIVGSRAATQYAANVSLLLGFGGLFWAFAEAGDVRFIVLVLCAILCGYVYQCPPFRLSYRGLGEPLCFAAFGPLATSAFYFSNSSRSISSRTAALLPLSKTVIASSILVGLTTTLILFCSHFHQIEGDRAVGKMSPLVRIGTKTGATLVTVAIGTLYTLLTAFGISRCLPPSCIVLGALTLPLGKWVVDYVQRNHDDDTKIFMAKYYCVRLHALFGMALASGLALARNGILA